MIQLPRHGLTATKRLADDQAALAAISDADGPMTVDERGSAGWASMRNRLAKDQHEKCGYCEDDLVERENEVDHIRPKAASEYWWLAFEVRNLILACRACNNFKRSKWELAVGGRRLVPRQLPWVIRERAQLVDPTVEDPSRHLTYRFAGGLWRISGLTARGDWTIAALELDRNSFLRRSNRWVLEAVEPRVVAYNAALEIGDMTALRGAIHDLVQFASPKHPWSQLGGVIADAVKNGWYVSPDPLALAAVGSVASP